MSFGDSFAIKAQILQVLVEEDSQERESRGRNGWAKAKQLSKQGLLASAQPQDGQQNKTGGESEEKGKCGREEQAQHPPMPSQSSSDSLLRGVKEKSLNGTEGRAPPPTVLPRNRLQRGTAIPTPPAPSRMSSVSSRTPSLSSGAASLSLGTPSFAAPFSQPRVPPPVPARKNFPSTAL